MNMLVLLPRLTQQEIDMMIAAGGFPYTLAALARLSREGLDIVIDALLEAERRGLFLTEGAALDLAGKLMSLRDEPMPFVPTQEQETNPAVSNFNLGLTLAVANALKD
jgi:hypothetical protein